MIKASDKRQQVRDGRITDAKRIGNNLAKAYFSKSNPPVSSDLFNEQWIDLVESLKKMMESTEEFRLAHNSAVKVILDYQKSANWRYSPPTYISSQKPKTQLFTPKWLRASWVTESLYKEWMMQLGQSNSIGEERRHVQNVLMSLIFHSGQCQKEVLMAFVSQCRHTPLSIKCWSGIPFITLTFKSNKYDTNVTENDEKKVEYLCYFHPFTLALLRNWNEHHANICRQINDEPSVFQLLTESLSEKKKLNRCTLSHLCYTAPFAVVNMDRGDLSHALLCVLSGETVTSSLPENNLVRLVSPVTQTIESPCYSELIANPITSNHSTNRKPGRTHTHFYRALKACFSCSGLSKLTKEAAKKQLEAFRASNEFSLYQLALLDWFIHKAQSCSVSTLNTYFSSLARKWLYINQDVSIFETARDGIEEAYTQIIELTTKNKGYFLGRLQDLHRFLVRHYQLPELNPELFQIEHQRTHVRSGFIDEGLFKQLLSHIGQFSDLNRMDIKALQCICIVCYRTGLRPSEVQKATFEHLESSEIGWLQIRENRFGDNKTPHAFRKVPLFRMLMPDELKLMKIYLRQRKNIADSTQKLLFPFLNSEQGFHRHSVSTVVGRLLKKLSGLEYLTMYHLRHSCLSKLLLLLEMPAEDLIRYPNICAYDEAQIHKVYDTIFGKNSAGSKYHALATFAGHHSPEQSFRNYLHFSDWVIATKLRKRKISVTLKQAMQCGIASRRVYKDAQSKELNDFTDYIDKKAKIPKLRSRLKPDSTPLPLITTEEKKIDFEQCRRIIELYMTGRDIELLAQHFFIDEKNILKWISNAQYLASLKTKSLTGNARLISQKRKGSLVPAPLKTHSEQKLSQQFLMAFRRQKLTKQHEILRNLIGIITKISTSRSGIYFNDPQNLATFIQTLTPCIKRSQWRASSHHLGKKEVKSEWNRVLKGIDVITAAPSSSKGRTGRGAITLELKHPDEKQILSERQEIEKYSSNTIVYIAHMVAIMMRKPPDAES
ncbi:hypothetical protein ATG66_0522 [Vibrio sp. ES.051]|uniref:hypothetical protein n=1 Tax=Vibrio sp. ES.051 TaxID=1761909 RepID=UPI000BF41971|nr:hypothetical protein [Vibrio sp. ES.051]PFG58018.1 hypothetical protein ATG66_0522 [Vibrio sp. ES.051]